MRLIAIGRLRKGPEAALFERFAERLRPRLTVVELSEGRGSPAEVKRREGEAMLEALPPRAWAVALDQGGAQPDSLGFAKTIADWTVQAREIVFLIGGAEGLDSAVVARADRVLSLGPMTWPHMLARAMLAEQLYRAQAIRSGHPYHKEGRPEAR